MSNSLQKVDIARKAQADVSEALDQNPTYCNQCGDYITPEEKLLLAIFGEDGEQICPECSNIQTGGNNGK